MAPPEYRCQQVQDRYADLKPQGGWPSVHTRCRALFSDDGVCDRLVLRGRKAVHCEPSIDFRSCRQLFPLLADPGGPWLRPVACSSHDDRSGNPNTRRGWSQAEPVRPEMVLWLGQAETLIRR